MNTSIMNTSIPSRNVTFSARLMTWVLEGLKLIGIALVCLVVIGIGIFLSIKTGIVISARWFGLFYWTCFLAWFICRQLRSDLRRAKFWVTLLAFLAVHVGAFVVVLQSYPEWRSIWFMLIALIEWPLMTSAVRSIVETRHHR
jgi:hypothetical protein